MFQVRTSEDIYKYLAVAFQSPSGLSPLKSRLFYVCALLNNGWSFFVLSSANNGRHHSVARLMLILDGGVAVEASLADVESGIARAEPIMYRGTPHLILGRVCRRF